MTRMMSRVLSWCPLVNRSVLGTYIQLTVHTRTPTPAHIIPANNTQVVITRLITSKGRLTSFAQAFQEAVKEGGLVSLYKGITAYVRLGV